MKQRQHYIAPVKLALTLLIPVGLAVTLFACGTEEGDPTPDETPAVAASCGEGQVALDGACVPELSEGWTQIFPGGETICARGTEFSYFVKKGTVNKLAVGFDGGGACWDTVSCSTVSPIFTDKVDESDNPVTMTEGLFDFDSDENPFRDWFIIFVPYCTGDVHWGDTVHTYPAWDVYPEVTIHHKGFVNGTAVMDWIFEQFDEPSSIFVTGVSAGSYGSLMFAPYLTEHYQDSIMVQLGDSGAGVITQDFLTLGLTNWDAYKNIPDFLTELHEIPSEELTLADVYVSAANYFPTQVFSQFNTAYDSTQEFYYVAMGGAEEDWHGEMEANIQDIAEDSETFRYYTGWGEMHGILPYDEFYTYQVNGVRIADWVADLIAGEEVENVHCSDCETEEYATE